jgi:phage FluMu gp28-like protein/transposase
MVSEVQKKEILLSVDAGIPPSELAKEYAISKATIYNWIRKRKKEPKDDDKNIIDNLKAQLLLLSKKKQSESISRKIAMLTKSIISLEKKEEKKKKKQEIKKKPLIDISSSSEAIELKKRALNGDFGNLFLYQKEFLESDEQFRIVIKSRQIGFSYVSALDALIGAVAGRNQLFLSASEEQALILMGYLDYWAKKIGIEFETDSTKEKKLANGATIKAMANNFRTVQGFTGDIWMDEFAWYPNPKKIWHAFVPSIGAVGGRLTIMSTPFEDDSLFAELIKNEEQYYMFKRFRIDIYRAIKDGLPFDLETMRALFDVETWASAYECQFIDDESALFSIELIKSCVDATLSYHSPSSKSTLFSGFDIARTRDRSALAVLVARAKGYELANVETLVRASFDNQRDYLKGFMNSYPLAQMAIDKTGIGIDISETIQKLYKQRVKGVHFTAIAKESMALNLKKMFEDKMLLIPNDPLLIADIHSIKRRAGQKGFLYDSDRNIHGHADRFWALALAGSYIEVIARVQGKRGKAYIVG